MRLGVHLEKRNIHNWLIIHVAAGNFRDGATPFGGGRRGYWEENCQTVCKPGSVRAEARDDHSSGAYIAARLARPTRATGRKCPCVTAFAAAGRSYSVLLPVGFALPPLLPEARCALTAPFHPCLKRLSRRSSGPGGLFSVALSLGSPPPVVNRHRISVEPGLSSTGFASDSGRPTVWQRA